MINISHILEEPYVDKGYYAVPDGYFNTLHDRIMNRIEEDSLCSDKSIKNEPAKMEVLFGGLWRKYAAVACLVGVISIVGFGILKYNDNKSSQHAEQQSAVVTEQYYDEYMEYAMVDNDDIYTYLAEQ